jgi:hypothetical protein
MACNCGGGQQPQAPRGQEPEFTVTLPNGQQRIVRGEHQAKVEVTMAGGGTYELKR